MKICSKCKAPNPFADNLDVWTCHYCSTTFKEEPLITEEEPFIIEEVTKEQPTYTYTNDFPDYEETE